MVQLYFSNPNSKSFLKKVFMFFHCLYKTNDLVKKQFNQVIFNNKNKKYQVSHLAPLLKCTELL